LKHIALFRSVGEPGGRGGQKTQHGIETGSGGQCSDRGRGVLTERKPSTGLKHIMGLMDRLAAVKS